jgi:peptide/nickel transport system permease protein
VRTIWRRPEGRIGVVLVAAILAFSIAGAWVIGQAPDRINVLARFQGPSAAHWLGTDQLGRDLAARLAYGGRVALGVAVVTIALALSVGTLLGIVAGIAHRRVERAILVLFDIIGAFPSVIFALAIIALLGPGIDRVVLIIAVTMVPHFGRVARAGTRSLAGTPLIEAERALGLGESRILFRHILPGIISPLVVLASMDIPVVITIEAGLSFLGLGIPPPRASWGTLLNDGYANLDHTIWPVLWAAGALAIATLGFTLLGEALRDALDPTLRRPMAV